MAEHKHLATIFKYRGEKDEHKIMYRGIATCKSCKECKVDLVKFGLTEKITEEKKMNILLETRNILVKRLVRQVCQ